MAVEGRTHRPIVDTEACTSCAVCSGGCPAEWIPEMRNEPDSLRGRVYAQRRKPLEQGDSSRIGVPPCRASCPLGQDVPGYIERLAQGRILEALERILVHNPLPAVCGHICTRPCEGACTHALLDRPVPIRALKEAAARLGRAAPRPALPSLEGPGEVAIIGSGPAGLSAARDLTLKGIRACILESHDRPGGMLAWAIPAFRLPVQALEADIEHIRSLGVDIRTGVRFGEDMTWKELRTEGFRALLLATGALKSLSLGAPGERSRGVLDGLSFLRRANRGEDRPPGNRVLVVGGGNTALDAARMALRLGARHVSLVYRRGRGEMPADPAEVREAEREGVTFCFLTAPERIRTFEDGRVRSVVCVRTELQQPRDGGRARPVPLPGTEHEIPADAVITAVGQVPDPTPLIRGLGLKDAGDFHPDPMNARTRYAEVFSAGDFLNGSTSVVEAMASGRQAAEEIASFLGKGKEG